MEYEKKKFEAEGDVNVRGNQIFYRTTAENFPISRTDGTIEATTFAYSYERKETEQNGRPVLFAWNGGPGSASFYLHVALLAPEKVKCSNGVDMAQTPPFETMENTHCILDICDIVVIDPIGTGYSRLLKEEAKEYWFSSEQDAEAMVSTIRQWLTAHKRWNSPIYLLGESYGTVRNALVAEGLYTGRTNAVIQLVEGVIMIGTCLNYGQEQIPLPKEILDLTSIAAAHWYWHREGKPDLLDFVNECDEFCYQDYLPALAAGRSFPEEKRREVAEKLSRYTGYSVEKLLEDNLHVTPEEYALRGMAAEGRSIGLYDARFELPLIKGKGSYDMKYDPGNAISMPAIMGVYNAVTKEKMNIDWEEEYQQYERRAREVWNFKTKTNATKALEDVMYLNKKMKLMFCVGLYDMVTTTGWCRYLYNHYDYPADRTWMKYYAGGHMIYAGDDLADQLQDDIREFILRR